MLNAEVDEHLSCVRKLDVIGVNASGTKHLVALREAMTESEQSWKDLFTGLKARDAAGPLLGRRQWRRGCGQG